MKHLLFLLLFLPLLVLSQESYERKSFYKVSDDIEIKVISLSKTKYADVGTTGTAGTVYGKAKKNHKIVFSWFKIRNTSSEKIVYDLTQIQVVDENSNVYDAYLCAGNGLNMKNCTEYELKIKPGKARQARIYFAPQIPKKTELKYLRVNGVDVVEF